MSLAISGVAVPIPTLPELSITNSDVPSMAVPLKILNLSESPSSTPIVKVLVPLRPKAKIGLPSVAVLSISTPPSEVVSTTWKVSAGVVLIPTPLVAPMVIWLSTGLLI